MYNTRKALALPILILLTTVSIPVHYAYGLATSNKLCIDTYFLAVSDEHEGLAIPVRVCLRPSHRLSLSIVGAKYDDSVYTSLLITLYTLDNVCGVNVSRYQVVVEFREHDVEAHGASASLTLAVAILIALHRLNLTGLWSGSGVLAVDGFVDAVGGIEAKLRAAVEKNISLIYVPTLNGFELRTLRKHFSNVRIVEVTSILDICSAEESLSVEEILNRVDRSVLAKLYDALRNDIKVFRYLIRNVTKHVSPEIKYRIEKSIANLTRRAEEALRRGHVYTAASLVFTAFLRALTIYYNSSSIQRKDLELLVQKAKRIVDEVGSRLKASRYISVSALPFLIVVLDRINEARYYADLYMRLQGYRSVFAAVMAYGRALTARSWLKMLAIANESVNGMEVPMEKALSSVERVLRWVATAIEWNISYAPLSLSTLAATRSHLFTLLSTASRVRVINSLNRLLALHLRNLDPIQRIVPYLYVTYARDLGMESEMISLTSLATLISAATRLSEEIMLEWEGWSVTPSSSKAQNGVLRSLTLVLSIAIALCLLATLYIVEKRLGLPTTLFRSTKLIATGHG